LEHVEATNKNGHINFFMLSKWHQTRSYPLA